ncbi:carbonic anhydrase [uncultured Roseovarius sp.]|jgi:carbonic anhydrase|uniref:carbonic anhydrase n=1 Tax=uncultured Roseovarius sp. TaxID=293344 RepID=UPI002607748C|nr:carbonic anhydrase [uncultured Roseovarius sp.]
MSIQDDLIVRNGRFAETFDKPNMPALPGLRTVLLACADARVDPAHVLGLELGEVIVIRNTGGRVTRSVIEEVATLSVLSNILTEGREQGFNIILMQHTQCGAQRLANPELQATLKDNLGIDVTDYAITDQARDLMVDVGRLAAAREVPDAVTVSAMLYDVATGSAEEIAPMQSLGNLRAAARETDVLQAG